MMKRVCLSALVLALALGLSWAEEIIELDEVEESVALDKAEESVELDEVVVTATRLEMDLKDLATNVSVINAEQIEQKSARTVAEALEGTVGVTDIGLQGTKGSLRTIRIRGGGASANHVLVLVDGQPMNSLSLGVADLAEMPTENVDRIEVVRGPGSTLWGANALGGVINIITKLPQEEGTSIKLSTLFGDFGEREYDVVVSDRREGKQLSLAVGKDSSLGWRENSAYQGEDLSFMFRHDLEERGKIGLRFLYHGSVSGSPGINNTAFEDYDGFAERISGTPDTYLEKTKRHLQLEYDRQLWDEAQLKTRIFGGINEKRYNSPGSWIDSLSEDESGGIDTQLAMPYGIIAGGGVRYDHFRRKDLTASPVELDIDGEVIIQSYFVQKELSFNELKLSIGERYDHHSVFGGQASPRVGLVWHLDSKTKLSSNLGWAYRTPTLEDLYSPYTSWLSFMTWPAGDSQGNTELEPETARGYDLGLEREVASCLTARVTYFRNDIDGLIQWANVGSDPLNYEEWRPSNVGEAYNRGVEVEISSKLFNSLSQSISYSYLESMGKDADETEYSRLSYAPYNRGAYNLHYLDEAGFGVNLGVRFVDVTEWSDSAGIRHKLPDYTLVDVKLSQRVGNGTGHLGVKNLTDRKYQSRENYPLPGRSFNGGMSVVF